jgi:hypothetical protein
MEGNGNVSTDLERTDAILHRLIDAHLGCLSAFDECLDESYAAETTLREIVQGLQERIRSRKESLTDAKQIHTFTSSSASHLQAQRWGAVTLTNTATASGLRYISLAGGEGEPEKLFKFICNEQAESSMVEQFVSFVTTVVCSRSEAMELHHHPIADHLSAVRGTRRNPTANGTDSPATSSLGGAPLPDVGRPTTNPPQAYL